MRKSKLFCAVSAINLLSDTTCKINRNEALNPHKRNHRYLRNPPEALGRGAAQLGVGGGEGGADEAHPGADHLAPAKADLVLQDELEPGEERCEGAADACQQSAVWGKILPQTKKLRLITATLRGLHPGLQLVRD